MCKRKMLLLDIYLISCRRQIKDLHVKFPQMVKGITYRGVEKRSIYERDPKY